VKRAEDIIPWKVTDISLRPFDGMWSFNPCIHYDGHLWRCVLRCSDYALPNGKQIRSDRAKVGESQTKNAMVIFNPKSWRATEIYKMREQDDLSRIPASSIGYEDVRIFRTDRYGLQGIAASLHLKRSERKQRSVEQVLLWLNDQYDIVEARPIRGAWSSGPQKNWAPFDHCVEPRFLYSIDKGALFGDHGELRDGKVVPSSRVHATYSPDDRESRRAEERADDAEDEREDREEPRRKRDRKIKDLDVQISGREELRGGSQLVRVNIDAWLGIGHAMKIVDKRKYYWHVWYLVDSRGKRKAASPPMKLAPNGIEFAAGLAVHGDRVVVSFGVDDMESRLGETKLPAVLGMLRPI
jgi:hypothetical protein